MQVRLAAQQRYETSVRIPGTREWQRRKYAERVATVREETGVTWRKELYVNARSHSEQGARELMHRLRAADQRELRAAETRAQDARIAKGAICSPRAADLAMAKWMRIQCLRDVEVCNPGADTGIDIRAAGWVAQVKFWRSKPVGRPVLQPLLGAADGKRCIVFALEGVGYTRQAVEFAEGSRIALFEYDPDGNVAAVTGEANLIVAAGWAQRNS